MKISPQQNRLIPVSTPAKKAPQPKQTLEMKKLRLRKATREFESFFILQMLQVMRQTIPKSGLLEGGLGQDTYTSMFDEQLARSVAGSSPDSLSQMLYKSLEKHLEGAEADTGADAPAKNTKLHEKPDVAPLDQSDLQPTEAAPATDGPASTIEKSPATQVSPVSMPKVSTDPILKDYGETISKAARTYRVDPRLVYSVIKAESNGQSDAVSPNGAKGLMQLIDSTATEMGVADSLDPHQNIHGGTKYLRQLLDRYDGNVKLAVAAYNAGPGAVSKYDGVPPYPETQRYVEKVLAGLHSGSLPTGR
jgi:soluble lytic murein transglycosylase-like protein